MYKQNLMPQAAQPVNRSTTGQLPAELAELSEEALQLHGDNSAAAAAVFASYTPSAVGAMLAAQAVANAIASLF